MTGFILKTSDNTTIWFRYYKADARITCSAFVALLPFTRRFYHDRVSGQEIRIENAPLVWELISWWARELALLRYARNDNNFVLPI